MPVTDRHPPAVLREYALVADGERGALCGPHGDLCWLCAPAWHSDAVFSILVGGAGVYAVTPAGPFVWGGSYERGSLIWRNRWVGHDGVVECRDALTMPADPHRVVVLRRIVPRDGTTARVRVVLDPRARFGAAPFREVHRDEHGRWHGRTGPLSARWSGAPQAVPDADGRLTGELVVDGGHDLVLEISDRPLTDPIDPDAAWEATEYAWRTAAASRLPDVASRDAAHAVAVLRGLTSGSGAMVAAATTSLPERAERGRNYDYRYAWIRDQCYAGLACLAAGVWPLADAAVGFVTGRLLADGSRLRPAYRVDGGAVPDERELGPPGYPGGRAVAGNHVNTQFQLDAPGEALQLLAAAACADRLDATGWRAAEVARAVIAERWAEPEAGIWELDDDWWCQSRLACVAGLRAAAQVAPRRRAGAFSGLADAVLAETAHRCLGADAVWQRSPTRRDVDASLVLPPVRGALPATDPRTLATLAAVRRNLVEDGYVYRYAADDRPLGTTEGSFLLCGFLLAQALCQQGETVAAFRHFERARAACGPPGLFSEEYDVQQRQLRGNLPQAFVHAALLETASILPG